ncbi:MAG: dihydrodipicolinate synthase family protein [Coprothermobacterota bacterium]|nr:dihydrodipicolinate synthase family protein [Coprothermobacterota bacterium]
MTFQGIFPALATPFHPDGAIDLLGLGRNLERYNRTDLAGYVVLGSNGEFALLEPDEKLVLIEFVRQNATPGKRGIAGTSAESTRETIRLNRSAADLGVNAVLVLPPHYYKGSMNEAALEQYFLDIAEAAPVPLFLYNMPANTGLNLSSGLVKRLARHPNIAGLKDSGGNIVQIAEVIAGVRSDFSVFAGSASFLFPTLALGGHGATLALANVLPEICLQIYQAVQQGDYPTARTLQLQILAANVAVTSRWGIAGLKKALDLLGYVGGIPRRPILLFDEALVPEMTRILQEAGAKL